jgi:hypothetical protein
VVVRLRGSYLNNAQATQRVAKLPREPVSGFLGMNPFATNQFDQTPDAGEIFNPASEFDRYTTVMGDVTGDQKDDVVMFYG